MARVKVPCALTLFAVGSILLMTSPSAVATPGDLDCLPGLTIDDVPFFIEALIDPAGFSGCDIENADFNATGASGDDIQPFIDALLNGPGVEPTTVELAGNSLIEFPFFEYVVAFNEDTGVEMAIDPTQFPGITGQDCDVYVVEAKTASEWMADTSLVDVRTGGATLETFSGTTIQGNVIGLAGLYDLSSDAGVDLGVGYDIVCDCDRDGELSNADFIDGFGSEAGFYVVGDTTAAGPLAVTEVQYSVGTVFGIPSGYTNEDTYYPTDIGSMGQLPLIVIGHGNGHDYRWYDHLGNHFASWGYVVMSHQNYTGPGIETASSTTLGHTDAILSQQATIDGGVLDGHIDSNRIVWIGHSRGAEGITRAYDRIYDGTHTPTHYTIDSLLLLSSMLPTDFLKTDHSNPHGANYHLWTASGDADVDGSAGCDICQTFHLHDRATGFRHSTVVQGTGHAWFHDNGGISYFDGPCPIYETNTHLVQIGYFLPLIKHYVEGNIPARDFFWRQYESFKPIGVPDDNSCIVVTNTYHNGAPAGNFVIDDYQSNPGESASSSGGTVTYTVTNLTEDRLDDANNSFSWTVSDPMNGMTHASSDGSDTSRGIVFDWDGDDLYYELEVVPEQSDFTQYRFLSFRACQGTQHPNTTAELGDLTFSVTLRDDNGASSMINIGAYGGGIEEPYQRNDGWHNEFETVRIRLTDFLHNASGPTPLDLTDIAAVRFEFGPSFGSDEGRIGMDDIELTSDPLPNVFIAFSFPDGIPRSMLPGEATSFDVRIYTSNEDYVPGTATLHYRFDGGTFLTSPLVDLGGGLFQATLPAGTCEDTPEFYVSAQGTVSGVVTDPSDAPSSVHSLSVGAFVVIMDEPLDSNPGWSIDSDWAFGQPTGDGGQYGGPDPTSGHTGNYVYGYNLNGDYASNLSEKHLTTTAFDCSDRDVVFLSFWRWLGVEQPLYDHAYISISTDGSSWVDIWSNTTEVADSDWVYQEFDISAYAADEPTVYVRWTMGTTDSFWQYCGWNIDDVQLLSWECE